MEKTTTKELARKVIISMLKLPHELNDGYGSYICEHGYLHDYSKKDWDAIDREVEQLINNPDSKGYTNLAEMWADLDAEDDDDAEV
jgi:hypothetical protein